jgi:hypothetical protein
MPVTTTGLNKKGSAGDETATIKDSPKSSKVSDTRQASSSEYIQKTYSMKYEGNEYKEVTSKLPEKGNLYDAFQQILKNPDSKDAIKKYFASLDDNSNPVSKDYKAFANGYKNQVGSLSPKEAYLYSQVIRHSLNIGRNNEGRDTNSKPDNNIKSDCWKTDYKGSDLTGIPYSKDQDNNQIQAGTSKPGWQLALPIKNNEVNFNKGIDDTPPSVEKKGEYGGTPRIKDSGSSNTGEIQGGPGRTLEVVPFNMSSQLGDGIAFSTDGKRVEGSRVREKKGANEVYQLPVTPYHVSVEGLGDNGLKPNAKGEIEREGYSFGSNRSMSIIADETRTDGKPLKPSENAGYKQAMRYLTNNHPAKYGNGEYKQLFNKGNYEHVLAVADDFAKANGISPLPSEKLGFNKAGA